MHEATAQHKERTQRVERAVASVVGKERATELMKDYGGDGPASEPYLSPHNRWVLRQRAKEREDAR